MELNQVQVSLRSAFDLITEHWANAAESAESHLSRREHVGDPMAKAALFYEASGWQKRAAGLHQAAKDIMETCSLFLTTQQQARYIALNGRQGQLLQSMNTAYLETTRILADGPPPWIR